MSDPCPDELINGLKGVPLSALRYFVQTGSTNADALAWAEEGAPDASLVVADGQTAGRGRLERQWITRPGVSLAFSLILRPTPAEAAQLPLFSLLASLAVCRSLETLGLKPEVKWPNDVLLERQKVCGILAEAIYLGAEVQAVVVGIGVNIAPSAVLPTDGLLFPAATVSGVLGRSVDRWNLLGVILTAFLRERSTLVQGGFLADWEARLAYRGERVRVEQPGSPALIGRVLGVTPEGNLRILTSDGNEVPVVAGEIRLRLEMDQHGGKAC